MKKVYSFNKYLMLAVVLSAGLMMTGCSRKVSEKELENLLPEEIVSYYDRSDCHTQKVDSIKITKRKTEQDHDYIECEINLSDERIERTLYESLTLTKYDTGGWQIDSWYPYAEQKVSAIAPPAEELISKRLNAGFLNLSNYTDNTDSMTEGKYQRLIQLDEDHKYAHFGGTVIFDAALSCYEPEPGRPGEYHWESSVNLDQLRIKWKAEGTWLLTENPEKALPNKLYYHLNSFNHEKEDKKPSVEAYYAWPRHDGNEYMGSYGNYQLESASICQTGEKLKDIQLELRFTCFNSFMIVLHPDSVQAFRVGLLFAPEELEVVYADNDQIFNEWNNYPKDYADYDFLGH